MNKITTEHVKQLEHSVLYYLKELGHDVHDMKEYGLPVDDIGKGSYLFHTIPDDEEMFYEEYEDTVRDMLYSIEECIVELQEENNNYAGRKMFMNLFLRDDVHYIGSTTNFKRLHYIGYTLVFSDDLYEEAEYMAEHDSIPIQWAYDILK